MIEIKDTGKKKYFGVIGLLTVAIIWGSGFVASDFAIETLEPLEVLMIRFFIAAAIMSCISYKKLKKINKQELVVGIFLGLVLYIAFVFQTIGLKYSTPAKNAFLTATNVIIVPFLALVIKRKKVDIYSVAGSVLALAGIGILSLKGDFSLGYGEALTLICAFCFAVHIYFTGVNVRKYDVTILMTLQMITAFVAALVVLMGSSWLRGEHIIALLIDENKGRSLMTLLTSKSMLSTLYLGVFSTTIAYFLQTLSQKFVSETQAAVIMCLESVFGTLFSVLIIHESLTIKMILGCVFILAGVLMSETKPNFRRNVLLPKP